MENRIKLFKDNYKYDNVKENHKLVSTMKVGGNVALYIEPTSKEEIVECVKALKLAGIKYFVCGNLSNTIIKDTGFDGAVIKVFNKFSGYTQNGNVFTVKSGTSMVAFASAVTKLGFGGIEFAGGIPGSVGGGVYMNAGAYGGQLSDCVTKVTALVDGEIKTFSSEELKFGYRTSVFNELTDAIILEVEFTLNEGDGDYEKLQECNKSRKEKQPLNLPNCGSVFKRCGEIIPAKLIDELKLKGKTVGGAMVSEKHCGFIVNYDNATASDVLELRQAVSDEVYKAFGVRLESEWVVLGE